MRCTADALASPIRSLAVAIAWGGFFACCVAVVLYDLRFSVSDHPRLWLLSGWSSVLVGTQFGLWVRTC